MTLAWVLAHQRKRIHSPWVLASIFVFGLPFFLMKLIFLMPQAPWSLAAWASTVFVPFLLSGLYAWASPMPWMWTGQGREDAPFFRGAFQAMVFALAAAIVIGSLEGLLMAFTGVHAIQRIGFAGNAAVPLIIILTSLPLMGYFISASHRTEHDKLEAERSAREAQWVLLRGQLSPHVLFNALNGLAELVRVDALAAETAILDLADLYRALLSHGSRPMAPLREERALLTRYLSVEAMRFGDRLRVQWAWDEGLEAFEAPPFLLQPSVENALKHGIGPHPEGGDLRISLSRERHTLILRVANTGKPLPLLLGDGVGVQNLVARLRLAYGEAAHHRLVSEGAWTVAETRIDTSLLNGVHP
jgi:sensor histidine kinase YesM